MLLKKLADHDMSQREEPFLRNFLRPFVPPIKMSDIPEVSNKSYKEFENSISCKKRKFLTSWKPTQMVKDTRKFMVIFHSIVLINIIEHSIDEVKF